MVERGGFFITTVSLQYCDVSHFGSKRVIINLAQHERIMSCQHRSENSYKLSILFIWFVYLVVF